MNNNTTSPARPDVDWSSYSETYDLLLSYNPAYREILELSRSWWRSEAPTEGYASILDVGAGTGTFGLAAHADFPRASTHLVDLDAGMLDKARSVTSSGLAIPAC